MLMVQFGPCLNLNETLLAINILFKFYNCIKQVHVTSFLFKSDRKHFSSGDNNSNVNNLTHNRKWPRSYCVSLVTIAPKNETSIMLTW